METSIKEIAASNYECYIRRAFKCGYNMHGAHADHFRILADTPPSHKGKFPESYDKQLERVTGNLIKATERFLTKFKLKENEFAKLLEINHYGLKIHSFKNKVKNEIFISYSNIIFPYSLFESSL